MCLIAVAHGVSDRHALIVAANRDERHARPSDPAGWWTDRPDCLGGRDRLAGGSWLAMHRSGRLAAVTNRGPATGRALHSRGKLVGDFLASSASSDAFAAALRGEGRHYAPFNLLLYDGEQLHFSSNRDGDQPLAPGVHSIGNTTLDSDWPKIAESRQRMRAAFDLDEPERALFELLAERQSANGGSAYDEAIFLVGPEFGTRSSTVVLIGRDRRVRFIERRFDANADCTGESRIDFTLA
jgi:uncharacterized protein with NRDE domain